MPPLLLATPVLFAADEPGRPQDPPTRFRARFTLPDGHVPVLLVDDDPDFCAGAARALERTSLTPFAVGGGVDALRFLRRAYPFELAPRPAFVVLDFNLPDLDAPAVLAEIRADAELRTIPVLVISQIPGMVDEAAARAAGAQLYSGKPSRAAALRELLLGFWRTHQGTHGNPGR